MSTQDNKKAFDLYRLDPVTGREIEKHRVFDAYRHKGQWIFIRENGEKGFAWGVNCWRVEAVKTPQEVES